MKKIRNYLSILEKQLGFKPTYKNLEDITGTSASALSNRVFNDGNIKDEEIEKIEKHYGISLIGISREDTIIIDYIHINPSCGHGTVVLDDADVTPIKLGTQMIENVLKISDPKKLKIFRASGDSMETIIEDRDMLLVDTGRTDFNNGGIFLLTINNEWFVKRLRKRLSGELDVISDNEKYPIETFKPNDNIEIVIKGRVIKNLSRGL